jgi:hypothetical protein
LVLCTIPVQIRMLGPMAESIGIAERGITFRYPRGRVEVLGWDVADFELVILKTNGVADMISKGVATFAVQGRKPFQACLTQAALDAMIRRCHEHGLEFKEESLDRAGWSRLWITAKTGLPPGLSMRRYP